MFWNKSYLFVDPTLICSYFKYNVTHIWYKLFQILSQLNDEHTFEPNETNFISELLGSLSDT